MDIKKGTTLELDSACMGNPAGAKGVCYEVYNLGGREGYSFIFPNGEYCGFSDREIQMFFKTSSLGHCQAVEGYQFSNVMQLSRDFDKGVFKPAWGD